MRRWLSLLVVAIPAAAVALLWTSPPSQAQPIPPPGLRVVTHGSAMSGSGTVAAPLDLRTDCSSAQGLAWDGDSWECSALGSTYTAGNGLSESPAGTFNLAVGTNLTITSDTLELNLPPTSCADGLAITSASADGTLACGSVCFDVGAACTSNYECCTGSCSGSVCAAATNDDTATPTWTGAVDDYALSDGVDVIAANLSGNATLSGMSGCTAGREVDIVYTHATSSGYTLTISSLDTASTLNNRFFRDGSDPVLQRGSGVHLRCASVGGSDVTNGTYWIVTELPDSGGLVGGDGLGADGDKGDFTVSGGAGNVATIDNDAINAAKIAAGAVDVSELADNLDLSGNGDTTVGGFGGNTQTSTSTGTLNDFALNDDTAILVFDTGAVTLNGITGGWDGRLLFVTDTASSFNFANEAGGSTAANRISLPASTTWSQPGRAGVWLRYSGTDSRWYAALSSTLPLLTVSGTFTASAAANLNGDTSLGNANTDVTTIRLPKDDGTAPTLSSCGTSPTVTGGSWAFTVTTGASATACTATFASTKTNAPTCVITHRDGAVPAYTVSATAITWGPFVTNSTEIFDVICIGDA